MQLFITINNFVHDFAAAMWLASIIAVTFLQRQNEGKVREVSFILLGLVKTYVKILVASIVLIILTGVARTSMYNYLAKQTAVHTYAVAAKHVLLVGLAVVSVVYVLKVVKKWTITEK